MGKITRHELSPILQSELDQIGNSLSINADQLSALEGTTSTATGDITSIQEEIIEAQSTFDSLNARFVADETRISTLETNKAEKTYVDSELAKKADKLTTYTKTETDQRIQAIINAAPAALDTLNEIAAALNNDPNFAGTITTQLANKVDKITGKGLSTKDFTAALETKLNGIEDGANNYVHPAAHAATMITQDATHRFATDTEKTNWNTAYTNNHTHTNKSVLDLILQTSLDNWNSAYTHIADGVKHITATERSNWNSDHTKITGNSFMMNLKYQADAIIVNDTAYAVPYQCTVNTVATTIGLPSGTWHIQFFAHQDANGYGCQVAYPLNSPTSLPRYRTSSGTTWDAWKSFSIEGHTHDDIYYTETESDAKFATKNEISTANYGDMHKSIYDANGDGIVDSAAKLATARTVTLAGDLTGSFSFDGSTNATLTAAIVDNSHNHTIANITNLQTTLDAKTPFATLSAATAATAQWYRIATSAVNIGANSGLFKIDFSGTGVKGSALFRVSCHDGVATGTGINQLGFTTTNGTLGLTQVRVVYHTTTTANYAYVEVYNPTALAVTYTVDIIDSTGWTLVAPSTVGSIPSGYTSKSLTFDTGFVSAEDVTATRQLISKVATGTAPLIVTSTTAVANLNVDMLDGQHGSYYAPISSPAFSGIPTVPTAAAGTSTTQAASTAFVSSAISALVNSSPATLDTLNELAVALGNDANFSTTMTNALASKAPLASPAFTGIPTVPTAAAGTNTTQAASTAFVFSAISGVVAGAVTSANKLTTARTITLAGDISGSGIFDGSQDIIITANVGDADTVDSFHASQTAGSANTIVVRDTNGHIQNTWFNSNRAAENTVAAQYLYDTGDGYMRKKNLANVRSEIVTSGFGIGGLAIDISTQDCNNIVNTGFYKGDGCLNRCPGSHTWTYLIVIGHDTSSWTSQIGINYNNDGTYVRTKVNAVWSSWRRLDATATSQITNDSGFITSSASITGNAATSSKWSAARTISLGGDLTGSVSIDGSANATLTATIVDDSHNHIISNVDGLQTALDTKTPFATLSATTAATAQWYRVATSAVNIGANSALFKVDFSGTGVKGSVLFRASCHDGVSAGSGVNQLGFTTTNNTLGLTQVRVVYHTTATANYAYVEVYNPTALAITYTVDVIDSTGWSLVTPSTVGSIPTGYTSESLTLDTGFVSAEDVTAGRQLISKVASGTAPLVVTSNTVVPNLNVDMLDGQHGSYYAPLASPAFSGIPTVPTAAAGTNSGQAASTSFVTTAVANKTSVSGNAGTATKLATARNVAVTGVVTGTASFDGSTDASISTTFKAGITWDQLEGV